MCRSTAVSHDGKYVIVFVDEKGDDNLVYYVDLEKNGEITKKLSLTPIITEFGDIYVVRRIFEKNNQFLLLQVHRLLMFMNYYLFQYVTNIGSKVVFKTNRNASNYRLVVIDLENPVEENWTTLIEV